MYCKVAMRYYSYDSRLGLLDRYEEKFGGMWKITVHKDPVYPTAISLRPSSITMNRKETRNLTYTIYPANADDRKARFASSNRSCFEAGGSRIYLNLMEGTVNKISGSSCAMYHSNCDELVIQGKGTLQLYGGSGPAIYGEFIRIAGGTILAQTGASNAAVIGVYSYYQHTVQNIRIMSGAYVTAKGGACALGSPSGKNKNVEYAPGTLTYSK